MDWDDIADQPQEPRDASPPMDLAGMLLSLNGFLVLCFGTLLLLTPVGDRQEVEAPDFGPFESLGIATIGVLLIVAAIWRREGKMIALVMGALGLLAAVACLAIVNAGLMAVVPTIGLLALINRPFPRPPSP